MSFRSSPSLLNRKKRYLQVALNSTLDEARRIIQQLPVSDRILVEVGTPLIKRYGEDGIRQVYEWYAARLAGGLVAADGEQRPFTKVGGLLGLVAQLSAAGAAARTTAAPAGYGSLRPYVVADLKTMDRGATEVEIAARGGASAAVALGTAPIETLNAFVAHCEAYHLDAMIDMMNVEYPLAVLQALKKVPPVVILHRGVDEERDNREKQLPLYEIRRIKGSFNIMVSIAGGDTVREVQSAVFNDADIVVVWKATYQRTTETVELVNGFLRNVK